MEDSQETKCNRMSRKKFNKRLSWIFLIVVVVVLAFLLFFFTSSRHTAGYREILTKAQLAELPTSMNLLKSEIRRASFNECWLFIRFQAEPNDIQSFVSKSKSIDINRKRPLSTASYSAENPVWWSINRSARGQIYGLEEQDSVRAGNVVVDEETDTVLIFIWYIANPKLKAAEEIWDDVKGIFK
jgi:hypothetical protein